MRKLTVFNFITLNGFFKGPAGDLSWHRHGGEESEYSAESLKNGNTLLFGRTTYEMMAGYWPSPEAASHDPVVAEGMNNADKIVFSKKLEKAEWKNTRILREISAPEIRQMKKDRNHDLTVLGSGTIVTQLTELGLIDEYQIMVDPVVLGSGTAFLSGFTAKLDMQLTTARTFKSGTILLIYKPTEKS